jgi:hypothetical protein
MLVYGRLVNDDGEDHMSTQTHGGPVEADDFGTLFSHIGALFVRQWSSVDAKFAAVDRRFDRVDARLDAVDAGLAETNDRLGKVEVSLAQTNAQLRDLEMTTARGFNRIDARFEELVALIKRDELARE